MPIDLQEKAEAMEFSTAEIAKWCGVSLKSVNNWAANNGVKKQGRFWKFTAEDVVRICEYYDKEPFEGLNEPSTEAITPDEALNEASEEPKKQASEAKESAEEPNKAIEAVYEELVTSLKEEITMLQEQLKTKDEQINNLIEGSREISAAHAITAAAKEGTEIVVSGKKEPSRLDYLKAFFRGKI